MSRTHLISERMAELPHSMFARFMALSKKQNIISLGPGEPDFNTPKHIVSGAKKALDKGFTRYSDPAGTPLLREAIAKKVKKVNKIKLNDPDKNVIVTSGSTEALLLAGLATIDPTEAVLVPNPGFLAYTPMVEMIDAEAASYSLSDETGFQIDIDALKKQIKRKTKAMILNTPSNPTGTVFKRSVLEELADLAVENDLTIISDEAYEDFVFDKSKHISIGSFNGLENHVISTFSTSKTYAMPGLRVGYAVGNEKVIRGMVGMHIYTSLCAPSVSQRAAITALNSSQAAVRKMNKEYDRRRKYMLKRLKNIKGLEVKVEPKGAFYVFPRFYSKKMNSEQFALHLLNKANVLTIPGTEFGSEGAGFLRLSYATDMKKIKTAMDRLEKLLGSE